MDADGVVVDVVYGLDVVAVVDVVDGMDVAVVAAVVDGGDADGVVVVALWMVWTLLFLLTLSA